MNFITQPRYILGAILLLAFLVRVVGINYGLPLWLVSDEPPFIATALKILEVKNPVLAFNSAAFEPIMYFPPYMAYVLLLPFALMLGIQYIFFNGTLQNFVQYIAADPSHLFIVARLVSVFAGVATVYFVYKIGKNIFNKELPALAASFFLATSILHVGLSMTARDWIFATFLFTFAVFVLSRSTMSPHIHTPFQKLLPSEKKETKYLVVAIIAGFAFGISLVAGFIMVFALLWYLLMDRRSVFDAIKDRRLYVALFIFLLLAGISIAIYPFGFHFGNDNSFFKPKALTEFFRSPYNFFLPAVTAESILFLLALVGCWMLVKEKKRFGWVVLLFCLIYAAIFYMLFYFAHRFTIYTIPLIALLAGYGLESLRARLPTKIERAALLVVLLLLPLVPTLKLDWLAFKNDSRAQARVWAEQNLPENTHIIVYGRLLRLSSTKSAIEEQRIIDPRSLRSVDRAEEYFGKNPRAQKSFHAINAHKIINQEFFENLPAYAQRNGYQYVLLADGGNTESQLALMQFQALTKNSALLAQFGTTQQYASLDESFFGNPLRMLKIKALGPHVVAYKIIP